MFVNKKKILKNERNRTLKYNTITRVAGYPNSSKIIREEKSSFKRKRTKKIKKKGKGETYYSRQMI